MERWVKASLKYNRQADYGNQILDRFRDYLNRKLNLGIGIPEKTRVMCRQVYLAQTEGVIIRATQNDAYSNQVEIAVNSKTCPGLARKISDNGLVRAFPDFDFKRS